MQPARSPSSTTASRSAVRARSPMIDDRPAATCAPSRSPSSNDRPTSSPTCCRSRCPPRRQGGVVRAELDRARQARRRRSQGRSDRGAAELPAVRTRRPPTSPTTATRPSSTSTPSTRRCSSASAADDAEGARTSSCSTAPRRTGMTSVDADGRRGADRAARCPTATEAGRDDDLHVGHHRQAEGCVPPQRRRPGAGRRRCSRSSATCPTTSTSRPGRSTTAGRAGSWASRWRSARPSCCSASSTRRTGCASSRRTRSRPRSRAPTPIRMICNLPADVKARYDRRR